MNIPQDGRHNFQTENMNDEDLPNLKCPICSSEFRNSRAIETHIQKGHNDHFNEIKRFQSNVDKLLTCDLHFRQLPAFIDFVNDEI